MAIESKSWQWWLWQIASPVLLQLAEGSQTSVSIGPQSLCNPAGDSQMASPQLELAGAHKPFPLTHLTSATTLRCARERGRCLYPHFSDKEVKHRVEVHLPAS